MNALILAISLTTAGMAAPVFAQHDHGAAPLAGTASAPLGRPAGSPPARDWTTLPLLLGKGERGERAGALIAVRGLTASGVTVYASEGPAGRRKVDYPVDMEGARIESVAPKTGNYHWVIAREESPDSVRVASTAWYFGNPGDSPKDMLQVSKHELEIVPAPLPREHRSYREAEKWQFLVRFEGKPLAGQRVSMETEFGSRSVAVTDADGHAILVFPLDHKPSSEGNDPRQRGRFVLATENEANGKRYLTAFNYTYAQDPDRHRSLAWGAAFGLLGMVAATPLLRRRSSNEGTNGHA